MSPAALKIIRRASDGEQHAQQPFNRRRSDSDSRTAVLGPPAPGRSSLRPTPGQRGTRTRRTKTVHRRREKQPPGRRQTNGRAAARRWLSRPTACSYSPRAAPGWVQDTRREFGPRRPNGPAAHRSQRGPGGAARRRAWKMRGSVTKRAAISGEKTRAKAPHASAAHRHASPVRRPDWLRSNTTTGAPLSSRAKVPAPGSRGGCPRRRNKRRPERSSRRPRWAPAAATPSGPDKSWTTRRFAPPARFPAASGRRQAAGCPRRRIGVAATSRRVAGCPNTRSRWAPARRREDADGPLADRVSATPGGPRHKLRKREAVGHGLASPVAAQPAAVERGLAVLRMPALVHPRPPIVGAFTAKETRPALPRNNRRRRIAGHELKDPGDPLPDPLASSTCNRRLLPAG